ncbi:unnamed protein product, partial [Mesorhabditis spiculigera]
MKLKAVGYMQDSTIVLFRKSCWNMSCFKPGIDVDFLNMALGMAGLEAEVIPFDYPPPQALAAVANGSADLTVHAIVQSAERLATVTLTSPKMHYIDFIVNSICPEVYLFLIFALIASPFAMWVLSGGKRDYVTWIFHAIRTILKQDTQLRRRYTLPNAIFMIFWIWFCFFFTQSFESAMKSTLTLSSKRGYEFQDLEGVLEAIENKGWRLVLQDETGWNPLDYCRDESDQCPRIQQHMKNALHIPRDSDFSDKLPPKTVLFAAMHSHLIQDDVVVIDRGARLLFIRDTFLQPAILGYAVNKNLTKVMEKLNKAFERMLGSYENFAGRYGRPYTPYRRLDSYNQFFQLRVVYLLPLFRLTAYFLGSALLALALEVILGKSGVYLHLLHEECRCEKGSTRRHITRNTILSLFLGRNGDYPVKRRRNTIA